MENVRICNENDMAAISGWESTAMENHSGLVDNFRDFKADPRSSRIRFCRFVRSRSETPGTEDWRIRSVRHVGAQRHRQVHQRNAYPHSQQSGEATDNACTVPAPSFIPDQLSYLLQEGVTSPPLKLAGTWIARFALHSKPELTHEVSLLVGRSRSEIVYCTPRRRGGRQLAMLCEVKAWFRSLNV
jgi:beta-galactosidase